MIVPTMENGRYQAIVAKTSCQERSQPGRGTERVATTRAMAIRVARMAMVPRPQAIRVATPGLIRPVRAAGGRAAVTAELPVLLRRSPWSLAPPPVATLHW
jgi:hypothetical protein